MASLTSLLAILPPNPSTAAQPTSGDDTAAPPAAAASLTADEIVARHVAARGGLDKIRSIRTLRERGRITAGEHRQAVVTRERKRPSFTRLQFTLQGVTSVQVFNGSEGWKMSPLDGDLEPQPLSEREVRETAEQDDIEGPLVNWKAKGHRVELVGREAIDGSEAYKLKVTLTSGSVLFDYIDVESFARIRSDSTSEVRGRIVRLETTFADHRKTDGILFPHFLEIVAVGRPQLSRVVVDSIEINPPLSDARFAMPNPAR